jgi:hypothetical protein
VSRPAPGEPDTSVGSSLELPPAPRCYSLEQVALTFPAPPGCRRRGSGSPTPDRR